MIARTPFAQHERRSSVSEKMLERLTRSLAADRVVNWHDIPDLPEIGPGLGVSAKSAVPTVEDQLALSAEIGNVRFEVKTWSDPQGHWLSGRRPADRRAHARILLRRSGGATPFSREDAGRLLQYLPEVLGCVAAEQELERLRSEVSYISQLFDSLPMALVLIDESLHVLASNKAGRHILAQDEGLGQKQGRLKLSSPETARRISAAVRQGEQLDLHIARKCLSSPYAVKLMTAGPLATAQELTATLVIRDPSATPNKPCPIFGQAFGLTPAETRLADQLAQGHSLVNAEERLGITHNTARTHMKRIYAKTGLGRQADLVRLFSEMIVEA